MQWQQLVLIIIGAVFILDTVMCIFISNWNMGVILPALLGIPLLAIGILYPTVMHWFDYTLLGGICEIALICGYVIFLLLLFTAIFLIMSALKKDIPKNADVIIVLGAAVRNGKPSRALLKRLETAHNYCKKAVNTIIMVTGGRGSDEAIEEAYAMRDYLTDAGISQNRIICETRSTSTLENFKEAKRILDKRFSHRYTALFVTNDFHVYRAGLAAKKAGLSAVGLGAPSPKLMLVNFYLRESLAILRYMLFGAR